MEPTLSGSHGPWRHLKSFLGENFSLTTLRTVFEKDQYFRASWQMATRNFNWFKICETKKHPTLYCIMLYCFCCTQLRECIVLHCIAPYCSILGAVHILRNTEWGGSSRFITILHKGGSPQFITILHRGILQSWLQNYIFGRNMEGLRPFSVLHMFLCSAKSAHFVSKEKNCENAILGKYP